MKVGITKFIPENIAPPNAKNLAVFNGNTKICDIDISRMQPFNLLLNQKSIVFHRD